MRVRLDCALSPQDALRALRGERDPFLLVGAWAGGGAVAGAAPVRVAAPEEDPFALADLPAVEGPEGFVGGGWVGYLGFGLARRLERLGPPPPRPAELPPARLAYYDNVLRLSGGEWFFEALVTPERRAALRERLAWARARLGGPVATRPWRLDGMRPRPPGYDGHRLAVADVIRRIAAGELFQANVCLRLEGTLDGDPMDAFADASARLAPAHGAFLGYDDGAVLSFSPELFLRRTGRTAWTAPIKGTLPRDDDPHAAAAARTALRASAKDAAEHVMIVDLMRNDLGRVAEYGSVAAAAEPTVEPHPGLWHLVSRVQARLRDGATDADLMRAAFPPGSVTGAPKIQSLHVISALEATAREVYTGAIGMASPVAGLELNVAIRTLEVSGPRTWLGCGGGIVADSNPDAELREALSKARPVAEALGGTVPGPGRPRRAPVPPLHAGRRPDPALGVLETLAVQDGRPVVLDLHLERLERGLGALPAGLRSRLEEAAAAAGPGRHRLRVVVRDGHVDVTTAPAMGPVPTARLVPVCLPGGLGEHKWADRRPLAAWPAPVQPLIVDADGAVLESGSANVWALEGDRLVTPPTDGRLLPGITRRRILEAGGIGGYQAAVEPLDLARLVDADAVLLTSSVALVAPVGPAAAPLAARLRAELLSAESARSATV